jgi:hypothetical protein
MNIENRRRERKAQEERFNSEVHFAAIASSEEYVDDNKNIVKKQRPLISIDSEIVFDNNLITSSSFITFEELLESQGKTSPGIFTQQDLYKSRRNQKLKKEEKKSIKYQLKHPYHK